MSVFKLGRRRARASIARFGCDEAGSAVLTYVTMLPFVFGVFLMTLDSGFTTMRASLVERAVDMTARSIRNGALASPTLSNIRTDLCSRLTVFPNCATQLKVQIIAVPRASFAMPARNLTCADQGASITPVTGFVAGQENPVAVLRACLDVTSFTPLALMPNRPGTYSVHAETVIAGSAT